jgi:hypothetical protein
MLHIWLHGPECVRVSMRVPANGSVDAFAKGGSRLRAALIQAAHAAGRTQTYLGEQYRSIGKRRGKKRAAVAVGHSILVIFYQMMLTGEHYHEKGVTYLQERDKQRQQRHLIQRLERLGYQVDVQPLPAA